MKNLDDLRRARAAAAKKMRERAEALAVLEGAEAPDAQALATAQADFEASEQAFEACDTQVKRAERVEAAEAAAAGQADLDQQGAGQGASAPAIPKDDRHRGVEVGLMVGALAAHRGEVGAAVAQLERGGFGQVAAALSASEASAGGVTIPRPLAQEVISLLRPRVVVRRAGARSVPMPAGQLRKARQTGSATASYGGEVVPVRASAPSFEPVDQSFKKLRALVPISNTLLAQSSIAMGLFVRDDLVKSMARREDLAFLRGAGASDDPIGMRNWIPAGNWLGSVAGNAVEADMALRRCLSRVEDADVAMTTPGWVMRASAKNWLGSLKDANGN
ncbi:MAG: phage major capsid protein, partial [Paracoccaceae bacterium]|nr:phage major capsid protein [Paracoccaceae bacterium]